MAPRLPRHIEYRPLDEITPAARNAKKHDALIGDAIERLGFLDPMIEDGRTGRLIAGHGRLEQLQAQYEAGQDPPDGVQVRDGKWWAPVTVGWSSRDDAQAEDANITLNRLTERGGWDDSVLAAMLGDQPDPSLLGWDEHELAALMADPDPVPGSGDSQLTDPDDIPDDAPAVTKPGDVWTLGPHRIMAGDCRSSDDVKRLLDGATINLAFTSPPYAEQRTYDETSGFKPIPPDEYVAWFELVASNVALHLADDGSWFVNIKEHCDDGQRVLYVKDLTLAHVRSWGWRFVDEFCWTKQGVPGRWNNRFKNGWEPIFHFTRSVEVKLRAERVGHESEWSFGYSADHPRSTSGSGLIGAGNQRVDGYQTGMALPSNVVTINTSSSETVPDHSAAFPVGLPQWFVKAYTDPGDTVYDPFVGSGSTVLAAHAESRVGFGMEISPKYVDIACKRFQRVTGIVPVRDGVPHDFLAETETVDAG